MVVKHERAVRIRVSSRVRYEEAKRLENLYDKIRWASELGIEEAQKKGGTQ
jgi:hypothetical protein